MRIAMTGRPQRDNPKQTCRLCINEDVYRSTRELLKAAHPEFGSLSQLVETIIFLSEHIYITEPDNSFAVDLAKLQSRHVIEQIEGRTTTSTRYIHVSLDEKAIAFIDLLIEKYPMLSKTRSDVTELLLLNITKACRTEKELRYYVSRLSDVLSMHPTNASMKANPDYFVASTRFL